MKNRIGVLGHCADMLAPKGNKKRHIQVLEFSIVILLPIALGIISLRRKVQIGNADIIVSGVGVLGGLLFAHAIFVFQLRMSYSEAIRRRASESRTPPMEKLGVPPMIDQMFYSVVYASALSLLITLIIGMASSLQIADKDGIFPIWFSSLSIVLITHLAGWVWFVITITVSAYRDLIKEM